MNVLASFMSDFSMVFADNIAFKYFFKVLIVLVIFGVICYVGYRVISKRKAIKAQERARQREIARAERRKRMFQQ